jgi:hypothetical protein
MKRGGEIENSQGAILQKGIDENFSKDEELQKAHLP